MRTHPNTNPSKIFIARGTRILHMKKSTGFETIEVGAEVQAGKPPHAWQQAPLQKRFCHFREFRSRRTPSKSVTSLLEIETLKSLRKIPFVVRISKRPKRWSCV